MISIRIEGIEELRRKFERFPRQFQSALKTTLRASLDVLTESVPPYPPQGADVHYVRTGTLGRSIGSGQQGGRGGQPEIYDVQVGAKMSHATWGTRLEYAPHVIGESQTRGAKKRGWYTIKVIAQKATQKIQQLFATFAEELAQWLNE